MHGKVYYSRNGTRRDGPGRHVTETDWWIWPGRSLIPGPRVPSRAEVQYDVESVPLMADMR